MRSRPCCGARRTRPACSRFPPPFVPGPPYRPANRRWAGLGRRWQGRGSRVGEASSTFSSDKPAPHGANGHSRQHLGWWLSFRGHMSGSPGRARLINGNGLTRSDRPCDDLAPVVKPGRRIRPQEQDHRNQEQSRSAPVPPPQPRRSFVPSREHEIPLRIVQNQPALAPVLLKEALDFEVPQYTEAVLTSSVLTNCDPKEWNSDGAVLLRRDGQDVLAVVIERQTGRDGEKRYSWPAYLATLYGRLKCPAVLVVLCPTDSVAQWCAEPIGTGHPGFVLRPLVIGPSGTPVVTDPAR